MGKWRFRIVLCSLLIGSIIFIATHLVFAKDGTGLRTQGLINTGGNVKSGYLIINEMRVRIDKTTKLMDHRGNPTPIAEFQPKKRVYMEIVQDQNKKTIRARRIYLLPRYVNPEERKQYPFMN